ncbi:phosphatase PAP2 family protein, partial [Escherichia coli]|nr:phosphatase PAP2 family protein [Escherichia coli]
ALFMQYYFPKFKYFFIFYVGWIWWATMYLNHHYAVDLVGGGLMAAIAYYISRVRWLPRPQLEKRTRWEYEYVEFGDSGKT